MLILTGNLRIGVMLTVLLMGLATPVSAQIDLQKLANDPALFLKTARTALKWDEPAEPAKIIGPIYFVGTKGLSVYLITTPEGHIILNTGMPGSGPMIEASIRKLGFKPEEIKLLLIGHAHIDHAGGHAYLQKLSGSQIAVIREEKDLFESGGKLDFHYGKSPEFGFEPAKVDQVFHDGDVLKLGDVAITALLTNGHTRGSTTFVMKLTDEGQTFTVVFPNGTSVNPGYRVAKDPSYPGIREDYQRTLRVLEDLKPDIWLMAHTEAFNYDAKLARAAKEGAKAWVDPEGYRKWIIAQKKNFDAAIARELGTKAK
ncbi:MAG: subclass B3 metallo-beta-lactamase [Planctomycetales bacterium]